MSQLQTRIDDEQVLSLQLQKKIKELQVRMPGPSSAQSCPRVPSLLAHSFFSSRVIICKSFFFFFLSLLQQHIRF